MGPNTQILLSDRNYDGMLAGWETKKYFIWGTERKFLTKRPDPDDPDICGAINGGFFENVRCTIFQFSYRINFYSKS